MESLFLSASPGSRARSPAPAALAGLLPPVPTCPTSSFFWASTLTTVSPADRTELRAMDVRDACSCRTRPPSSVCAFAYRLYASCSSRCTRLAYADYLLPRGRPASVRSDLEVIQRSGATVGPASKVTSCRARQPPASKPTHCGGCNVERLTSSGASYELIARHRTVICETLTCISKHPTLPSAQPTNLNAKPDPH